jgi:hypothetical protein
METLLNQYFDVFTTGKIVGIVIEAETRNNMMKVMEELIELYENKMNIYFDKAWGYSEEEEYDKEILTIPFITCRKYRKSWVKCDHGEINSVNNSWRDNVFTDKLRDILLRNKKYVSPIVDRVL